MLVQLFVHVFGRIVECCSLEGLSTRRDQVEDRVRCQLEARSDLLICGRLKLNLFGLVPYFDHIQERLEALDDQVLLRGLKHEFFDEVDHLVDERDPQSQVTVDHHFFEA